MFDQPHFQVQEIEDLEKENRITNEEILQILADTEQRLLKPELMLGEGAHGAVFTRNQAKSASCVKLMWDSTTTIKAKNNDNSKLSDYYRYLQSILSKKGKFEFRSKNSARDEAAITNKAASVDGIRSPKVFAVVKLQREVDEWDEQGTYAQEDVEMLVMERVRGMNIEQIIDQSKFPLEFLPETFSFKEFEADLLDQIERLHEAGIYHRDITLRNVMIESQTGKPWIIDFGISNDVPGDDPYFHLSTTVDSDDVRVRGVLSKLREYCKETGIGEVI
jgi:predicted Ser/Thr protein kinase